ncbi:MAG TPA: tetratricopeptide repeat protein [bacterium]
MKWTWLAVLAGSTLLVGCSVSPYRSAEKYVEQKEYNQAIREYLILLEPHMRDGKRFVFYDREGITGIGVVYWEMKRYETAVKILKMVVEKDPAYGKALFYLGMSYEGLGNETEAIRAYKSYSQLSPDDLFRQVLAGRLDWMVRNKIAREIDAAMSQESQLNPATYPERSVAVLSFLSLSDNREWEPLQTGLAEMIITDLSQVEGLEVAERLKVDQLMDELQLSASGLADENTSLRFGKLVGVRNLVKGSYLVMGDRKMTLDAGVFQAANPAQPTSYSLDGNLARVFQMEKELVFNIISHFGITLTPQEREKLLKIPTESMDGFMHYCRGVRALDHGDFKGATRFFQSALMADANFEWARNRLVMPEIWDVTHSQNLFRMSNEVAQWIKVTSRGIAQVTYKPPPDMLSTYSRLQLMGRQQSVGFLPGNESREAFDEAIMNGVQVLPELLGEPPQPPQF